jgi:hypothetical protein
MLCSRIEAVRFYTDVLGLWKKMTEIPVRRGWWLRVVSPEVTGRHRASPRTVHLPRRGTVTDALVRVPGPEVCESGFYAFRSRSPSAPTMALLRWVKPGRGGPIRPGRYQITRASSANASARRAVGRTSVPRSSKPRRRFWTKACPGDDHPRGLVTLSPRIGRRRALRRPWSVSSGLFAWAFVSWKAAGSSSPRTRG